MMVKARNEYENIIEDPLFFFSFRRLSFTLKSVFLTNAICRLVDKNQSKMNYCLNGIVLFCLYLLHFVCFP